MPHEVTSIDLTPIKSLLALILERCKPVSVWLFGSRARGLAREDSDWDLLVVLPDETSEEEMFDNLSPWRLRRLTKVNADVVYCNDTEFAHARLRSRQKRSYHRVRINIFDASVVFQADLVL